MKSVHTYQQHTTTIISSTPSNAAAAQTAMLSDTQQRQQQPPAAAFCVVPLPGKGMGCVSARDIHAGERLIAEAPLVELQGSVRADGSVFYLTSSKDKSGQAWINCEPLTAVVDALSAEDRVRFFSLCVNERKFGRGGKTAAAIFSTNAIPYRRSSRDGRSAGAPCSAVFATIARFNHACAPNAKYSWNETLGQLTVHAIQSISAGHEVCVSYGYHAGALTHDLRRQRLQKSFGFECDCAKCSLTGSALDASERRLSEIGTSLELATLAETLHADHVPSALNILVRMEARYALYQAESPGAPFFGLEAELLSFVSFCDLMVTRIEGIIAASAAPVSDGKQQPLVISQQQPSVPGLIATAQSPGHLRHSAAIFRTAARRWATESRDVCLLMQGADAPAVQALTAALESCWLESSGAGAGACHDGSLSGFAALWQAYNGFDGRRLIMR